ncbi:MAG: hypothetical protein M1839_004765 [Geoglossum umbratile]|nr:MAG: hypothetical protein M1839_004765 [Geoglossum umbratile]
MNQTAFNSQYGPYGVIDDLNGTLAHPAIDHEAVPERLMQQPLLGLASSQRFYLDPKPYPDTSWLQGWGNNCAFELSPIPSLPVRRSALDSDMPPECTLVSSADLSIDSGLAIDYSVRDWSTATPSPGTDPNPLGLVCPASIPPNSRNKVAQIDDSGPRDKKCRPAGRISKQRRQARISGTALLTLQSWLNIHQGHPYPTSKEKQALAELSKLTYDQVQNWFNNNRWHKLANLQCGFSTPFPSADSGFQITTTSSHATSSSQRGTRRHCLVADTELSAGRDPYKPLQCTFGCPNAFATKSDFDRHEKIHCPQEEWICCYGLPYVFAEQGLKCAFCDEIGVGPDHVNGEHNCKPCIDMPAFRRTFKRKDKFLEHLAKKHNQSFLTPGLESWCRPIANEFRRQCGFCGEELETWSKRIDHIANHFFQGLDMSHWQDPWVGPKALRYKQEPDEQKRDGDRDEDEDGDQGQDPRRDFGYDSTDGPDDQPGDVPAGRQGGSTRGSSGGGHRQAPADCLGDQLEQGTTGQCTPCTLCSQETPSALVPPTKLDYLLNPPEGLLYWTGTNPGGELLGLNLLPGRALGRGSYGSVRRVTCPEFGGVRLARKVLRQRQSKPAIATFINEIKVLQRLQHPHIIRFIGAYREDTDLAMLLYPVADCNLKQYLGEYSRHRTSRTASSEVLGKWMGCLSNGLDYLHARRVIHTDIKPGNILLVEDQILFTDFGASCDFSSLASDEAPGPAPVTPMYCAPEVYHGKPNRTSADIFSLGCVFLEIVTLLHNKTLHALHSVLSSGDHGGCFHSNLPQVAGWIEGLRMHARMLGMVFKVDSLDIITAMIDVNPERRPTATDLVTHFAPSDCCLRDPTARSIPGRVAKPKMELPAWINGVRVSAILDTGSEFNIISAELIKFLCTTRQTERLIHPALQLDSFTLQGMKRNVIMWWIFADEPGVNRRDWFNILPNCTADIIVGYDFLRSTLIESPHDRQLPHRCAFPYSTPHTGNLGSPEQALFGVFEGDLALPLANPQSDLRDFPTSIGAPSQPSVVDTRLPVSLENASPGFHAEHASTCARPMEALIRHDKRRAEEPCAFSNLRTRRPRRESGNAAKSSDPTLIRNECPPQARFPTTGEKTTGGRRGAWARQVRERAACPICSPHRKERHVNARWCIRCIERFRVGMLHYKIARGVSPIWSINMTAPAMFRLSFLALGKLNNPNKASPIIKISTKKLKFQRDDISRFVWMSYVTIGEMSNLSNHSSWLVEENQGCLQAHRLWGKASLLRAMKKVIKVITLAMENKVSIAGLALIAFAGSRLTPPKRSLSSQEGQKFLIIISYQTEEDVTQTEGVSAVRTRWKVIPAVLVQSMEFSLGPRSLYRGSMFTKSIRQSTKPACGGTHPPANGLSRPNFDPQCHTPSGALVLGGEVRLYNGHKTLIPQDGLNLKHGLNFQETHEPAKESELSLTFSAWTAGLDAVE